MSPKRCLSDEARRFAAGVASQEILREAASALGRRGVPVVPLKGVLFQRTLYDDPSERFSSDVDLLVLPQDFERAVSALLGAGFRFQKLGRSLIEAAFASPRGFAVDLHFRLFGFGRFDLSTRDVFRRARPDARLFGVPVLLADPYDLAAHLVGKLVTDHVAARPRARLAEISLLIDRHELDPTRLARHLVACGLGRAARYALALGVSQTASPDFFSAVLRALPPDRVGEACAWVARQALSRTGSSAVGSAAAHSLNASLARGLSSAGAAAINRVRHARVERVRRRSGVEWVPLRAE